MTFGRANRADLKQRSWCNEGSGARDASRQCCHTPADANSLLYHTGRCVQETDGCARGSGSAPQHGLPCRSLHPTRSTSATHAHVRPFLPSLAGAVLLACTPPANRIPPALSTAASSIRGTVTYRDRSALPPDAEVEVWIMDASPGMMTQVILAQTTVKANGRQVPIPFELRRRGQCCRSRTKAATSRCVSCAQNSQLTS